MSEARPALRTDNCETSGHGVETECGRPPPTGTTAIRGKHSTVPCVFTPGLHGLPALSGVLTPPCVTVRPGMSTFSRDLYFWTGRTNPPSAQIRVRGPELPLGRREQVVERLLGLDAIAPSPGCGSPEGGRYCRLGAHRRPMPGGRLVRMDCSSACCSLRLFERTGYLFVRARGPCRPGTAYVRAALKRPPAVVAGGPEITSKTAAKSPFSWYYIGKGTSESAAVDVEVGISLYGAKTVARRLCCPGL